MKVLFVETFSLWPVHLEYGLELAQRHLDENDMVDYLACNADLASCTQNLDHDLRRCMSCVSRRRQGLKMLSGELKYFSLSDIRLPNETKQEFKLDSIDDLRMLRIEGVDVGEAVLSSIISIQRNATPSIETIRALAVHLLWSSWKIFLKVRRHLESNVYDRVYIFNGRFAESRVVLRLCQQLKVDCYVHERGADFHRYSLSKNTFPHDISYKKADIEQHWLASELSEQEKLSIAFDFYQSRAIGKEQSWYSFVAAQENARLPDNWEPSKKNIVIFTSSEDEYAAIGADWRNHIYPTQYHGICSIIKDLSRSDKINVYVRMHPNTAHDKSDSTKSIYKLSHPKAEIITPESTISTYELIRKADSVLTFGSTVGIEAAFWGTPSVLAGKSIYRGLGSVYLPATHDQVVDMLLQDLSPLDKLGSIKYGFYMNTFGEKFIYFDADGVFSGKYKGKYVKQSRLAEISSNNWTYFFGINWIFKKISNLHRSFV